VVTKWSEPCPDLEVVFDRPFIIEQRVLTACEKKLLRIGVRAARDGVFFRIVNPGLCWKKHAPTTTSTNTPVKDGSVESPFHILNPDGEELTVTRDIAASYVWSVDVDKIEPQPPEPSAAASQKPARLEFSAMFKLCDGFLPSNQPGSSENNRHGFRPFSYVFDLSNLRASANNDH
jgi:hypothetical protein